MSIERELLKRFMIELTTEEDVVSLFNDIKKCLAQPEQDNTQYLLDQVARLTAENAMLKEKWSTPKPEQTEQEPVAWMSINNNGGISIDSYYDNHKDYVPLYTAPPVKSEHIEDKLAMFSPVGYLYKQMDCYGEWATIFKLDKPYITWHDIKDIVPVYTAPPKREPLSDEEIDKGYQESDGNYYDLAFRDGVRFAEKHNGIGGEE